MLLLSLTSALESQDFPPPVYPTGDKYDNLYVNAGVGSGDTHLVFRAESLVVKVSWSNTWDRTITFQANTTNNLSYQDLVCTELVTGITTSTPTTPGAYLCPVLGKQRFRAPISGGTAGIATATIVAKLPIAMPVITR